MDGCGSPIECTRREALATPQLQMLLHAGPDVRSAHSWRKVRMAARSRGPVTARLPVGPARAIRPSVPSDGFVTCATWQVGDSEEWIAVLKA